MDKQRQIKILSIVALVLAVSAMTLGFAAFSTTLNISSSATVTPNSEDFKLTIYGLNSESAVSDFFMDGLYDESNLSSTLGYGFAIESYATACVTTINNTTHTISNIKGSFDNKEDQVLYLFVLRNEGKYDAYLDLSDFPETNGVYTIAKYDINGICTPTEGGGATASLVESACTGVNLNYGFINMVDTTVDFTVENEYVLPVGEEVVIGVSIKNLGPWADGPFDVSFADVDFDFSTAK